MARLRRDAHLVFPPGLTRGVIAVEDRSRSVFGTLRENLDPEVDLRELDLDVNDPEFAHALADRLHTLYEAWSSAPREVRA